MTTLSLILILSVFALWFFINEYHTLFGVYEQACAMRRVVFNILMPVLLLVSLFFCNGVRNALTDTFAISGFDEKTAMLVLLLSLIVLMVLRFFGVRGSVIYAFLGSLMAYGVISDQPGPVSLSFIASFFAAQLIAFIVAAAVRIILKAVFSRVKTHMIKMSYCMRIVIIVCLILTVMALGFNWGGMLFGIGDLLVEGKALPVCVVCVVAVVMSVCLQYDKFREEQEYGLYSDFSIYALVSVGLAVAVTLMLFSFDAVTSLIRLSPVPLSVPSLVISAIAGTELAQKTRLVGSTEYIKEGVAFIAAPGCAFVLTYLVLHIIVGDSAGEMADFIVMAASVLILAAIAFAGYVRSQRLVKVATERLVYSQQQQIYENARALNDMELKVVVSENQALHNAVEMKRQEVMNVALSIVEQKEYLQSLNEIVKKLSASTDEEEKDRYISELGSSLRQRLSYERDVDSQYFYAQAEYLHEDFNAKLTENFPDLTQQEKRLATLLRLGFSSKYIATLMNITVKSVEISRYRLRLKLGLSKGDNLVNYIKSI